MLGKENEPFSTRPEPDRVDDGERGEPEPFTDPIGQSAVDFVSSEEDPVVEGHRRRRAHELGLPDEASWGEIFALEDRQERVAIAQELGWVENLQVTAAMKQVGWDPYPSWRKILTLLLEIPGNAPVEDMIDRIRKMKKASEQM